MVSLTHRIKVDVFGIPTPDPGARSQDGWREAARWLNRALERRCPGRFTVCYHDLLSSDMNRFSEVMDLLREQDPSVPLVFVDGHLVSQGRKLSLGVIERYLEGRGTR